jgi:7-keto-8-aminopelargonate synthetase-like enzyme
LDRSITAGIAHGVAHLYAEDTQFQGGQIRLNGRLTHNFASCSYLGLEQDPRLRAGVIDALERYGTQFSSSRTYISAPPYALLEELLQRIFRRFVVITPSTTLGHLSALPVLISPSDTVLIDNQVHASVQLAARLLKINGTSVHLIRHSSLEMLETYLKASSRAHGSVWYLADGVYSMHGDLAPFDALHMLLKRHRNLRVYFDDAHGIGWSGSLGSGTVVDHFPNHDRVIIAASLNKSFASAGGALLFADAEQARRVGTCGEPLIFGGPIQPPMLGAAIASARLHLSDELPTLQRELRQRIALLHRLAHSALLPIVSPGKTPICFVGVGLPAVAHQLTARLLQEGFLVNSAVFPAVPRMHAGIRLAITRHHSEPVIEHLIDRIRYHLDRLLAQERRSLSDIRERFGLPTIPKPSVSGSVGASALSCDHRLTIEDVDRGEWNISFPSGMLSYDALRFLEEVFAAPEELQPENRWNFHYFVVREPNGQALLKTVFTEALWKEELISESQAAKERRLDDGHTSGLRVLAMGTLLTEGRHLWIDETKHWRVALELLVDKARALADELGVSALVFRDFSIDSPVGSHLESLGFARLALPSSMALEISSSSEESFVAGLGTRARRFVKREVLPHANEYEIEFHRADQRELGEEEIRDLFDLYQAVLNSERAITVFPLPISFFQRAAASSLFELMRLFPRNRGGSRKPAGFVLSFLGGKAYVPLVVGLDYEFVQTKGLYRQCLWRVINRAIALNMERVELGMGAETEKARLGAKARTQVAYLGSSED